MLRSPAEGAPNSERASPDRTRIERLAEKESGPVEKLQMDGLAAFGRMHKLKKALTFQAGLLDAD